MLRVVYVKYFLSTDVRCMIYDMIYGMIYDV